MPYHDDAEATQWLQDYWDYVQMIEHGNEPSLDEIGGWDGLAQAFMDDDVFNQTVQYISDDIESDDINSDAGQLLSRLKQLKDRYMGMSKMKKSYFDDSHYYVVGKHANELHYHFVTPDGELTEQSIYAMVFDESQKASDVADELYHDNPTYSFKVMSESGYDMMGNRVSIESDDYYASTKKMKKSVRDRIDSEYGTNTYDTLRMAMFGDEELSRWSEEELNDPDSFIEWAIEEGGIPKTMRSELMDVFNEEYGRFKASTKKMKKSDEVQIDWEYRMPVIEFIQKYDLPLEYYIIISGTGYPGTRVGSNREPLPEKYYNCPVVMVAVTDFMGKFVEVYIDVDEYEASTKKSQQDIHSMIADIRKNNNSLKKSRVDLKFE